MKKLTKDNLGNYLLDGKEVFPVLVYGPVINIMPVSTREKLSEEQVLESLIREAKNKAGKNLREMANSYVSGAFNINSSDKSDRYEFYCFFRSVENQLTNYLFFFLFLLTIFSVLSFPEFFFLVDNHHTTTKTIIETIRYPKNIVFAICD